MKKGILILAGIFAMSLVSCKKNAADNVSEEKVAAAAERDAKSGDFPVMEFAEVEHDFGTINEGDIAEHTFSFTNTGKTPLVITNAKGSCGCTVPSYPKQPIAPGATAELLVKFNSKGKPNKQQKTVTITANTATGKEKIKIKAMVTPAPKDANAVGAAVSAGTTKASTIVKSSAAKASAAAGEAKAVGKDILGGKSHHSHKH